MLGKTTAAALTKARQIGGGLYGKSKENLLNLLVIANDNSIFANAKHRFLSREGDGKSPHQEERVT